MDYDGLNSPSRAERCCILLICIWSDLCLAISFVRLNPCVTKLGLWVREAENMEVSIGCGDMGDRTSSQLNLCECLMERTERPKNIPSMV